MGIPGNQTEARKSALTGAVLFCLAACICVPLHAAEPPNLALRKPASSSSIENDDHKAARANDGDPDTYWCADDEPEDGPEWWQVDLEKTCELAACQIRWPYKDKRYRYKVEGSTDRKKWSLLERSDENEVHLTSPRSEDPAARHGPLRTNHDHRDGRRLLGEHRRSQALWQGTL